MIEIGVQLETLDCFKCHALFALELRHVNRLRETGETFYCPAGHPQAFVDSELKKTKRLLDQERLKAANLEQARDIWKGRAVQESRRAVALRGVVTRTKRRIAAGKCPCCHSEFSDLQQHMSTEHPAYGSDDA